MPEVEKCPICGGLWYEGECYKCGAFMEAGKVVIPKSDAPAAAPVQPVAPPAPRSWDEP